MQAGKGGKTKAKGRVYSNITAEDLKDPPFVVIMWMRHKTLITAVVAMAVGMMINRWMNDD